MVDNRIVIENAQTEGVQAKSYWDAASSQQIEGFATDISVNAGNRVDFKINVNDGAGSDYRVEIFRLGYYDGNGAREVAEWTNQNATVQPDALQDRARGLVDAGNWAVTDSWDIPADAVSGVYLARLQRLDANGNPIEGQTNQIPFIVRNDGVPADIVLQTSDTTWQAYNGWGGNNGAAGANFYGDRGGVADAVTNLPDAGPLPQDRAYAVSYNRPFITRDGQAASAAAGPQDYLFGADYAAITWLEKNGYNVSYISGVDTDRLGPDYLQNYKAFISVGHDEYWSGAQRTNVEAARDAGVNLLFWSGNEVYWKTRWETSISPDGTEYRTLVCYKETWANGNTDALPGAYANLDPSNEWTGTWRDLRFVDSVDANGVRIATGALPENQLTGQLFGPDGNGQQTSIDIPTELGNLRVWRDTAVAGAGPDLALYNGILGYEWNTVPEDAYRPDGLIRLSLTTREWGSIVVDEGNTGLPGTATHSLSLYRDPQSGALVFGSGTTFWTWGLSDVHDSSPYGATIANQTVQQFTINMFADMGIQPGVADAILASQGLVRALASTDTVAATAAFTDTLATTTSANAPFLITGTASDVGGVVALVEVSFDQGTSWRPAQTTDGWATWSYQWRPTEVGVVQIQARAIDDSLNVTGLTPDIATITVTEPVLPDRFSLFDGVVPVSVATSNDGQPVELGLKFTVDRAGSVAELRYFRTALDSGDTDTREGHLWRVSDGALLGTATFVSVPGQSGWQAATLNGGAVALQPGVEYIVSYRTANNYANTPGFFAPANEVAFDGIDDNAFTDFWEVISAPQNSVIGQAGVNGNGIYSYDPGLTLPNQTFNASNYWVDVSFVPSTVPNTPPVITSGSAFTIAENQTAVGAITATDAESGVSYSISGGADAARFAIDSTTGALRFLTAPNFEVPADLAGNGAAGDNIYEVTVSASDGFAPPVTQAVTVAVTDVAEAPSPGSSIFQGQTPNVFTPAQGPSGVDATDYELGTKFTVAQEGFITQLQYFRGDVDATDTDIRTLTLWNAATGQNLGSVAVTAGVGATGWQAGTLAAPIAVQAGITYIVSYSYDQDGTGDAYAFSGGYFATAPDSSPDGLVTAPASGQPTGLGVAGAGNGLFSTTLGTLPQTSFNSANYWADVVFVSTAAAPNTPPVFASGNFTVAENQAQAGTVLANDAQNTVSYGILGGADAGLFAINPATGALSFLTAPDFEAPADSGGNNIYNLTVTASDGIAPPVTQDITVTVTDVNEAAAPTSIFADDPAPAGFGTDQTNYELGLRFTANANGAISGLQYYRGTADASDTDVRTLTLWSSSGVSIGTATVTSAQGQSGWQIATLAAPVAVQAGQTYIVSYGFAPDGDDSYAFTSGFFAAAGNSSPDGSLTAAASGVASGLGLGGIGNGLFNEGAGVFPQASFNASNYWVDVVFTPASAPANTPPVFTSGSVFVAAENQVLAGTVSATDTGLVPLSYGILAGGDGALFRIDPATGQLRFRAPQDFEAASSFALTVTASDGTNVVQQALTVTLADVLETVNGTAAFTGTPITANYVFGTTLDALFPGAGASQTATVGEGVEFQALPAAGPDVGNGAFGLASADLAAQTIRIEFPLDAAQFPGFLRFAGAAEGLPLNGVHLTDAAGVLPTILSARIIGQEGFTNAAGRLVNLSAADLTVTADGIFLNVAGKGRLADVNGDLAGSQHSYVTLLVDLNDAPVITANGGTVTAALTLDPQATLVSLLTASDADLGQTITYALSGEDAALFQIQGGALRFISAPGALAPPAQGATPGYQVTVLASDGFGGQDSQALTITLDLPAVNTPPQVGAAITLAPLAEDTTRIITAADLLAGATDPDGDALSVTGLTASSGSLTTNADGSWTFTPAVDDASAVTFAYGVTDGAATTAQTATLDLTQVNDAPVVGAAITLAPLTEDTTRLITAADLLAGATDPDGDALSVTGLTASSGSLTTNADGSWTFTPAVDDTTAVTFAYGVTDGAATTAQTATLDLTPVNDAPVGGADSVAALRDVPLVISAAALLANDGDIDTPAGGLSIAAVQAGASGAVVLNPDGSVTFTPPPGATGIVSFTYQISDGSDLSAPTLVTVTIADSGRVLTGNASNNTLTGGAGDDTILGLGGNDRLDGAGGNDVITGGTGNDTLIGGEGDDTFAVSGAGDGFDAIFGGAGAEDWVVATAAGTVIGLSAISGIEAIDAAGFAGVRILGSAAANLFDFSGVELIGITAIDAGAGNDTVIGSGGDDTLIVGLGDDALSGGNGNDVFAFSTLTGLDSFDGGAGQDSLRATVEGAFVVLNGSNLAGIETIDSAGFANVRILGTRSSNLLDFSGIALGGIAAIDAGAGNDTVIGAGGADTIIGGSGNDALYGWGGDDTFIFATGSGTDSVDGGLGTDTLQAFGADAILLLNGSNIAGIEAIDGAGFANVRIQGTTLGDLLDFTGITLGGIAGIEAGSGNDTVIGSGGADRIIGGSGNDVLAGMGGDDVFVFGANTGTDSVDGGLGTDTLQAFGADAILLLNGSNIAGIEAIDGAGFANVRIQGTTLGDLLDFTGITLGGIAGIEAGSGNDTVIGSGGADRIIGGSGNDVLAGMGGDDVFVFGANTGTDSVDGGTGLDTLRAMGNDAILLLNGSNIAGIEAIDGAGFGNVRILGTSADDVLSFAGLSLSGIAAIDAGGGRDVVTGSGGADRILAGSGNDTVTGGSGNDVLSGGSGVDRFVFNVSGFGADRITDFVAASGANHELIDLRGLGLSFGQLTIAAEFDGALVTVGTHGSIQLSGIVASAVTADDFLFV